MNTETAWAAGFFDGEGCVSSTVSRNGKGYRYAQINVSIGQVHREVLDRFCVAVGMGKVYGPYLKSGNRQPQWRWDVSGVTKIRALLAILLPVPAPTIAPIRNDCTLVTIVP